MSTSSKGDQHGSRTEEFVSLLSQHERKIYGYILSLVPNWADAEEILQETYIRLWRQFDRYVPGSDFTAWSCTIAHYQVLTYRKQAGRRKVLFSSAFMKLVGETVSESHEEADFRQAALNHCLEKLPVSGRAALELCYQRGLPVREAAERLGRTTEATYKLLARLRQSLQECVEKSLLEAGITDSPRVPVDEFREIHDLLTAQLRGRRTSQETSRLDRLVTSNSDARRAYVRHIEQTVALDLWAARGVSRQAPFVPESEVIRLPNRRKHRSRSWGMVAAVAAALLLVTVGLIGLVRPTTRRPVDSQAVRQIDPVLSANRAGLWECDGKPITLEVGRSLQPGRWRLAAGVAELEFAKGVRVVVDGPAELELRETAEPRLNAGKLVAHVPAAGVGFRLDTPAGAVIDRGTEFGLAVRPGTGTELHVFGGMVEAAGRQVAKGNAVRLVGEKGTAASIPLNPNAFTRYLPQPGVFAEYFDSPNLTDYVVSRIDPDINIDGTGWDLAPPKTSIKPDGKYSIRWTGFVHIDRAGDWTFTTYTNDGVRLWVNDVQIIQRWQTTTGIECTGTVQLAAGWHSLKMEYFQSGNRMAAKLFYAGPDVAKRIVPTTAFSTVHPVTGARVGAR
jgi:RNA polymerase sigma-70 factor (ECF subfamily)